MSTDLSMSSLTPRPLAAVTPWGPHDGLADGVDDRGAEPLTGVLPPPADDVQARELEIVRELNANRDADAFTRHLAEHGSTGIWFDFAREYRKEEGFVKGWAGTGLLAATLGVTKLRTAIAKEHYDRDRPYQVDPTIVPVGPKPHDDSYPSGHASSSAAAATTLGFLWPERKAEFEWWANQVALSRMQAGMHFPSDVQTGAALGRREALRMIDIVS